MSERLIDAVCPHCGRLGTTVRVVLHEDGYTKLSRQCTDCGNEWVHTFDHDWLAVAKNKKLQADNERLTSDVALVSERVRQLSEERDYAWSEVEKLRAEIDRLRAALKPFASLFLWPDDVGDEWTANNIRSGEDWNEEQNDAQMDDMWVRRGDIRAGRAALEGKP